MLKLHEKKEENNMKKKEEKVNNASWKRINGHGKVCTQIQRNLVIYQKKINGIYENFIISTNYFTHSELCHFSNFAYIKKYS